MTSSSYDHVGVVCRFPCGATNIESLYLLEATGDGIFKNKIWQFRPVVTEKQT